MSAMYMVLFQMLLFATGGEGRMGVGGSEQDWGYITVRPHAHMFWWLYFTTYNNVSNYTDRPLIIWLQGGPGMASSGYGNFIEIGPLNASLHKREGSFVENFNVLFVDNPVGVGYSYISDNETRLVENGNEIGEDLYNFFREFITARHPEFKTVPIYVFGESYGGKMATEFIYNLKQKEKINGEKLCNLKGLALGDAYISPMDYLNHYASLALNLGLIDKRGFTRIDELAKQTQLFIDQNEYIKAVDMEKVLTTVLYFKTMGLDVNNILTQTNMSSQAMKIWDYTNLLENLMNNEVKNELNITSNVTWRFLDDNLCDSLEEDLMKSIVHKVEVILNTTDIKIVVYNGILDFLVNTAGTISWLDKLNWKGADTWHTTAQNPLIKDQVSEGYYKKVDNLVFYAILRAGHSVPLDNLPVMNMILQMELQ